MLGTRQVVEPRCDVAPGHVDRERDGDRTREVGRLSLRLDSRAAPGPGIDEQAAFVAEDSHVDGHPAIHGGLGLSAAREHSLAGEAVRIGNSLEPVRVDVEDRGLDALEDLGLRGDDAVECLHPLEVHRADRGDHADGGLHPVAERRDLAATVGAHLGDEHLGPWRQLLGDRS